MPVVVGPYVGAAGLGGEEGRYGFDGRVRDIRSGSAGPAVCAKGGGEAGVYAGD